MFIHTKRIAPIMMLFTALVTCFVGAIPQSVHAADKPSITMESDLGFGGNTKLGEWGPLTLTLTSDTDISGEVVVQTPVPYTESSVTHVKAIDLPAGTPKKVTFGVRGNRFDKFNTTIRFYKGTVESGELISFSKGTPYLESTPEDGTLIGVLASDPDSLNFLRTLNSAGGNLSIVTLKKEQVPEDGTVMSSLDFLFINDYSVDTLSDGQRKAIRSWIKNGGTLVFSGGPGYPKSVKGFEDLSPVDYAGNTYVSELPGLTKISGKKLTIDHPFPVSAAKLKEGATAIARFDAKPLIASRVEGKGKVVYAAYDIAMEPLNGWGGHPEVWSTALDLNLSNSTGKYAGSNSDLFSGVMHLLDYFPSMTVPPFSLLMWLLLGYAVLVAPLLYYVLKKLDKREWAWALIPLIAIVASGGIYMAGTTGKTSIQTHTFNIMELDGKGQAVRKTASALFVPRGGNYTVELSAGTYLSIEREDGLLTGGQNLEPSRQSIRVEKDRTTVKLHQMTHRSIAKLWMDQPETRKFGAISIDAGFNENGKLQGSITNLTNKDLSDAALILGDRVIKLGDLPKQKTVPIPTAYSKASYNDFGGLIFPFGGGSRQADRSLDRQRGILNSYMNQSSGQDNHLLIAWSKEQLSSYKVNGKNVKSDQLNMWVQSFEPTLSQNGEVNLPFGYVDGRVIGSTPSQWNQETPGKVSMSSGDMQIEYRLPSQGDIIYSGLTIRQQDQGKMTTAMIWNADKKDWQELNWTNGEVKYTDQANQYLQNGAIIRIQITAKEWTSFDIPEISLQGRNNR
ncbi:hypothetical protein ACFQ3W_02735 [Paenibacillus puldeungensis]|uniref:DUF7408 domain-containing protein n=1 Tax=Paenibacillus puldeungensis TaxID=696536 RepID=A0ABW3RS47_9BACL